MTRKPQPKATLATLSQIERGESCRVISIEGGQAFRSKMHQMGIHGAERVVVRQNGGFGPLVLEAGGTRLVIGRRMADRLWVSRI
jgi:ferrous iron transport protein A